MGKCPECGFLNKDKALSCFACEVKIQDAPAPKRYSLKITPIKRRSLSMTEKMKEYNKLKKVFLTDNYLCTVFPKLIAIDIHHVKGREGDLLLDTTYWRAVSREGHIKIHTFPLWAIENGFSESRLQI